MIYFSLGSYSYGTKVNSNFGCNCYSVPRTIDKNRRHKESSANKRFFSRSPTRQHDCKFCSVSKPNSYGKWFSIC